MNIDEETRVRGKSHPVTVFFHCMLVKFGDFSRYNDSSFVDVCRVLLCSDLFFVTSLTCV